MKNLVDSCGWISYLVGDKNADRFARPINLTKRLIVPTICLYEVYKKVFNELGANIANQIIAQMSRGQVIALDTRISLLAAKISKESKLAMADSIILATAKVCKARVWTSDRDFVGLEDVQCL